MTLFSSADIVFSPKVLVSVSTRIFAEYKSGQRCGPY
jgi:hypothetical protein